VVPVSSPIVERERFQLRQAAPGEAAALTDLARRSKRHWGYDDAFIDAVRAELTVSEEQISGGRVFVLERERRIIGFYGLHRDPPTADLTWMFVDPDTIGRGHGRRLWEHAVGTARALGYREIVIESDPYAEGFYRSMGARREGESPSRLIPGRVLPFLRYSL
jgi:GNAT superfamily N-acetyltransferase